MENGEKKREHGEEQREHEGGGGEATFTTSPSFYRASVTAYTT